MDAEHNEARQRIRLVSKRFSIVCVWLMVGSLVAIGAYWLVVSPETLSRQWLSGMVSVQSLTPVLRGVGLGLTLIAALPMLSGLNHLRRLFLLYAEGTMFGELNVQALRGLGRCLILFSIVQMLFTPAMALALSAGNPPGERLLSVGVTVGMLEAALVGGLLLVIAWVMNEARKIDEEQQLTV
ncbi:DUF2975 domain-containing protein [Ottowia thiooxydans]|uniref:Membrane protein n=1 Tax=Ottowia thiooxydans TaxID=219182 RepID=A0ABV2Q311_9BURK